MKIRLKNEFVMFKLHKKNSSYLKLYKIYLNKIIKLILKLKFVVFSTINNIIVAFSFLFTSKQIKTKINIFKKIFKN